MESNIQIQMGAQLAFKGTVSGGSRPVAEVIEESRDGIPEKLGSRCSSHGMHFLKSLLRTVVLVCVVKGSITSSALAQSIWNGGGAPDSNWTTGGNWGGIAPVAGNTLTFTGTVNTSTNNDFAADTVFSGITFDNASTAGEFTLAGNRITLGGDIVTTGAVGDPDHLISLDLVLDGDRLITAGNRNNLTFSGVISETGGARTFSKVGAGTVTLSGLNTFTGQFIARQGTTVINTIADAGTASAIGAGSTLRLGQGSQSGTLRYIGGAQTTNRQLQLGINNQVTHTGGGSILNDGSGALVFTNAVFNLTTSAAVGRELVLGGSNADNNEIRGIIANNNTGAGILAIAKEGEGTWILSGDNTYDGSTTVSDGILIVNGNQSGSSGVVSVASGATLGGDGVLGGDTTVDGILSTGNGIAAGTVGDLGFNNQDVTFNSGSVWLVDLVEGTSNSDAINGINDLTLNGTVNLTFETSGAFDGTGKFTIATYSGILSGSFAGYADDTVYAIGTGAYLFNYDDGGAITLTAVPEPGTLGLITAGLGGLLWRRSRRNNGRARKSKC